MGDENHIKKSLNGFRRRYYRNEVLKGILYTLLVISTYFLVVSTLDFTFRFGTVVRGFLFFSFSALSLFLLITKVIDPLLKLLHIREGISEEEAAEKVGRFFPAIRDKLLNLVQLEKSSGSSPLAKASILQRARSFENIPFQKAVDYSVNKKYVRYLSLPVVISLIILLLAPQMFSTSTARIVNFTEEYAPVAPFTFLLRNERLTAFRNEDFTVALELEGEAFPESVYMVHKDLKYKMIRDDDGKYTFTFEKIQNDKRIHFEGAGFSSASYTINVVNRPNLKNFSIALEYPLYLNRKNDRINNVGNLEIPEGTRVSWQFNSQDTEELHILFGQEEIIPVQASRADVFAYERTVSESQPYSLILSNSYSENKDGILYMINVIKDQYPQLNVNILEDTATYRYITIGGNISDDYGLTRLALRYTKEDAQAVASLSEYQTIPITIDRSQSSQGFFYQWMVDSLNIREGEVLRYYIQVWDNDGVNGIKSSKSSTYVFKIPDEDEIRSEIGEAEKRTEEEMNETLESARQLQEQIDELEERLKSKPDIDWKDQQLLKEMLEQREALEQKLQEMKQEFEQMQQKKERFSKEQENEMNEKADELDKLLDQMMDEETREMYEELQKLMEEMNKEELENSVNELNRKQRNLTDELERTLELFKRMQIEQKLQEAIQDVNKLSEEQQKLSEETADENNATEEISEKQEEINKDFEEFQEKMEEIKELNQDLKYPEPIRNVSEENNDIQQMQEQIQKELQQGERNKAKESQKRSSQKMKELSRKMEQMAAGMQVMMMQENLDNLRDILQNLLQLSFDQEDLMKEFRGVNQSDPRFIELSQQQLKLQDDARIIEDSLTALASRVAQISSFVTREVSEMNRHMDESVEAIRDRKKTVATSSQQFAMTSINNLALLLDDTFQQMQQVLADAMGTQNQQQRQQQQPSLGEMQQKLNQQISEVKQSGKSGRELSEELAKLAAEQERIRRALQEMQEKYGENQSGPGGDNSITEKMEQTEIDLVNKRITEQTIRRQQDILTRLLEAEDALRERDLEEEREAETARQQYEKQLPKAYEEYFKNKQKEIELLKTVPPRLYPYYKKEVNEYFERLRVE